MTARRDVLRGLAAGAALPFLARLAPDELLSLGRAVHAAGGEATLRALSATQQRALAAACEGVLPAGESPGASAAGVDRFIDVMLADWHTAAEKEAFLAGLGTLDARARGVAGQDFADCGPHAQAAILVALDDEAAAGVPAAAWFGRLKYLTIWGYFTSEVGAALVDDKPLGSGRFEGCAPRGSSDEAPS